MKTIIAITEVYYNLAGFLPSGFSRHEQLSRIRAVVKSTGGELERSITEQWETELRIMSMLRNVMSVDHSILKGE